MNLRCEQCGKTIEYSGDRPLYCAFCGAPLPHVPLDPNLTQTHNPATLSLRSAGSGTISRPVLEGAPGETSLPSTLAPDAVVDLGLLVGTKPPERVGAYRVLRRLGGGGMGAVYEAEDELTNQKVAVKVIKQQMAMTPGALERFRQEGRLASLISHPRCVFVLKAEEEEGRPYIVMELMPGATLKDLVRQQGPLAPAVAVTKMIDVIDGLAEAHALGVIHRDVKPSNCFLMTDGRVKIGDFGLSKLVQRGTDESLFPSGPANAPGADPQKLALTRTGAFLGTPLFASPEQIKGEPIDFRSDVYSAAATLYFLLTGKAPHEGGDPNAVVARIVADPVPPISKKQPRVPPGLERAVMRGLQKQKERRWQSLEDFRDALVPYLPSQASPASRTARLRALAMDAVILLPLLLLIVQMVRVSVDLPSFGRFGGLLLDVPLAVAVLAYFGLLEGLTGATLGKRLLRLRVRTEQAGHTPRKRQLLVRELVFFGLIFLPGRIAYYVSPFPLLGYALNVAGLLVILDTMRRGNGYRGLHDLLSRTQVVQLPWPEPRPNLPARDEVELRSLPPGWPNRIGPYRIDGLVQANESEILIAGEDPILERPIWISIQPQVAPVVSSVRREITRPTRLRWLASGTAILPTDDLPAAFSAKLLARPAKRSSYPTPQAKLSQSGAIVQPPSGEGRASRPMLWDAFLAGEGSPLPEMAAHVGPLPWADARFILEQLIDELAAGAADGTLPRVLKADQIWVQANGRILLIGPTDNDLGPQPEADEGRALRFLGDMTVLMLEGSARPPGAAPSRIRAPAPEHARPILDRLVGLNGGFASLSEAKDAFRRTRGLPAALTTPQRFSMLWVVGTFLAPFLLAMFLVGRYYYEILPTVRLNAQIRRAERVLKLLKDPKEYEGLLSAYLPAQRAFAFRRGPLDFLVTRENQLINREQREMLLAGQMRKPIEEKLAQDRAEYTDKRKMMALAFLPDLLAPLLANRPEPIRASAADQAKNEKFKEIRLALRHALDRDQPDARDDPEQQPLLTMNPVGVAWGAICVWPLLWIAVAAATGGGAALRLLGLQLVRSDGQPARAWQAALRSLLLWLPVVLLLGASVTLQHYLPGHELLHWGVWWLAVIILALYGVNTLVGSGRSLPDRLAGVYLLPK